MCPLTMKCLWYYFNNTWCALLSPSPIVVQCPRAVRRLCRTRALPSCGESERLLDPPSSAGANPSLRATSTQAKLSSSYQTSQSPFLLQCFWNYCQGTNPAATSRCSALPHTHRCDFLIPLEDKHKQYKYHRCSPNIHSTRTQAKTQLKTKVQTPKWPETYIGCV